MYLVWSLKRLVDSLCNRLLNKFDVVMVIEGRRGLGKSTLGFKILKLVKLEMKRRGIEGYDFKPRYDILYTKREVQKFFHKRKHSGLADEMINVTFNRDFYNEDQKDIVKMINMNRDHNNLFIACVPQFKVLDSQIKNLCSMKITVVRRGVALIHTPNKTVYSSDIWDERVNEKIERTWLLSGIKNPRYTKLTTFRGFVKFPKLSEKQELLYQNIKDEKRNVLAQEKGLEEKEKKEEPFDKIYNALVEGKIKNTAMLDGMIMGTEFSEQQIKKKLRRKLKENSKMTTLAYYYYDKTDKDAKKVSDLFYT